MSPLIHALQFLISVFFDLCLLIIATRLILVWTRADYFNQFTQLIVRLTKFIINPLRRILPNIGFFETASFIVLLMLGIIKYYLLGFVALENPHITGVMILAIADSLRTLLNIFFYSILIVALISWIQPMQTPLSQFLGRLASPIMRPLQRMIPLIHGFDLSPIPALIIIQLIMIVLVAPLFSMGQHYMG